MHAPISEATDFWQMLDDLAASGEIKIDRPTSSRHPTFKNVIYPLDYGYIAMTVGGDGEPVDCWIGSESRLHVTGIFATVDPYKRDCELKLCLGCNAHDIALLEEFHKEQPMNALFVTRTHAQ